jgi:hypothetical protein
VICIGYKDLSAGAHDATWLHGRTEHCDRGVTVYLLPGLTSWQRRAVIRRLRQEASRGFGPALPPHQLAVALALDRVRTAARVAGSIVRLHPTAALLPSGLVAALMTLFVVASAGGAAVTPGLRSGGLTGTAAVADGSVRAVGAGPSLARMARTAAGPVAVTVTGLGPVPGSVPGTAPRAQPVPVGGNLLPAAPGTVVLSQPAGSSSWYVCPRPVSGPVWLARHGEPGRPCSSSRAGP